MGLLPPVRLVLRWRQVAQGGVEALVLIDLIEEATEVLIGLVKVGIVMERDFCCFEWCA